MTTAVYIGNQEIAGHYKSVAKSLRRRGYHVTIVGAALYRRDPEKIEDKAVPRAYEWAFMVRNRLRSAVLQVGVGILLNWTVGAVLLAWSLRQHRYYILYGGACFVHPSLDYRVLRAFNKQVVVNCGHGSESRPPYLNSKFSGKPLVRIFLETRLTRARLRAIEKNADFVVCLPCLSHFFSRPLVSRDRLGKNAPVRVKTPKQQPDRSGPVRVIHIPSDPVSKGTGFVREAVAYVAESAGEDAVVYQFLENLPHAEVMKAVAQSDIIVTQMFSDIPWPTIALEAAAVGVLPILGGLDAPAWDVRHFEEHADWPVFVRSEDVKLALKFYAENPDRRHRKARALNDFVRQSANVDQVAANYMTLLTGDAPSDWFFDPQQVVSLGGDGMARDRRRSLLRRYIAAFGPKALRIPNRDRANALVAEAEGTSTGGTASRR